MKYIVVSLNGQEQIFAFPKTIDHDRMLEAIGYARIGHGPQWERAYMDVAAIGAGFVDNGLCHGKSESLGVASREDKDTALLSLPTPAGKEAPPSWDRICMKYIAVSLNEQEQIFVFPKTIDHDRMMEAIGATRIGRSNQWERAYRKATAIGAGFIENGACHGKSESLSLASRGAKDTALLSLPAPVAAADQKSPLADERYGAPKM